MFDYNYYVPILKGKKGEFVAVFHLPDYIKTHFTPLFDIPRPDNSEKFDEYLLKKVQAIQKCWGNDLKLFIDYFDLDLNLRSSSGQHYIQFSFDELRNKGIQAIPVTGLDRDDDYNAAVALVIYADNRGVVLRLQKEDIEDPAVTEANIRNLLSCLKVKTRDVHLLLDLRDVHRTEYAQKVIDVIEFLSNLGDLKKWKTLVLSASGFPESMSGIPRNSETLIPRTELDLWEQVLLEGKKKKLNRLPAFSDYGICHPDVLDFDPTMNPSANIRYTLSRNWLIVKGVGLKRKVGTRMIYDYQQFYDLANRLRTLRHYLGENFSYGDLFIYNCRRGVSGPGHLPKWREIGTNHHLTIVSPQIANISLI